MARPTIYSEELALEICEQIAQGNSLRSICERDDMPAISSVLLWVTKHTKFSEQYARAREAQADYYADELIEIADTVLKDNEGKVFDDPTAVARAKLRIETRKWVASKLKSKSYGDKVTQEITGKDGGAIQYSDISNDELEERLRELGYGRNKSQLNEKLTNS